MYGTFSCCFKSLVSLAIGGFKENNSANQTCVGGTL